jgi:cell division inhibitor SulA
LPEAAQLLVAEAVRWLRQEAAQARPAAWLGPQAVLPRQAVSAEALPPQQAVPLVSQVLPVTLKEEAHWPQVALVLVPEALLQLPALPVS